MHDAAGWFRVSKKAAQDGDLAELQRLRERAWEAAFATRKPCDLRLYLGAFGGPWDSDARVAAAEYGRLECLKFLHENWCPWHADTCFAAVETGHLECLKYAHENECPWNEYACIFAVENGLLDCLKYAHEHKCYWSHGTRAVAVENAHLKYTREYRCYRNRGTRAVAAVRTRAEKAFNPREQSDCAAFIRDNGSCLWDEDACAVAAACGDLDTLKHAHMSGCPLDEDTCHRAVLHGHLDCFDYLVSLPEPRLRECDWKRIIATRKETTRFEDAAAAAAADEVIYYAMERLCEDNTLHYEVREIKIALDKVTATAARDVADFMTPAYNRLDDLYEYIPSHLPRDRLAADVVENVLSAVRDIMAVLDECKGSAGGVPDDAYAAMATSLQDIHRDIDSEHPYLL